MSTVSSRRPAEPATPIVSRNWLSEITKEARPRPSSMILYGVPGVGKTATAAHIPGVVFLVHQDEDGLNQLKQGGLVPQDIPALPLARTWADTMGMLEALRTGEHQHKCLAIDALGGFERLCHEEVCRREYGGDFGKGGFASYMQGYDVALTDWRHFIIALDKLRDERGMSLMILGHSKVALFKNPEGPDYDRYSVDIHHKTWSITHRWADMVLFVNYEVSFGKGEENKSKAKASGGQVRIAYTEHHAAYEAKNRHGLPSEIELGNTGPADAWKAISTAIRNGRVAGKVAAE